MIAGVFVFDPCLDFTQSNPSCDLLSESITHLILTYPIQLQKETSNRKNCAKG